MSASLSIAPHRDTAILNESDGVQTPWTGSFNGVVFQGAKRCLTPSVHVIIIIIMIVITTTTTTTGAVANTTHSFSKPSATCRIFRTISRASESRSSMLMISMWSRTISTHLESS